MYTHHGVHTRKYSQYAADCQQYDNAISHRAFGLTHYSEDYLEWCMVVPPSWPIGVGPLDVVCQAQHRQRPRARRGATRRAERGPTNQPAPAWLAVRGRPTGKIVSVAHAC
jgi:hypothetical protein